MVFVMDSRGAEAWRPSSSGEMASVNARPSVSASVRDWDLAGLPVARMWTVVVRQESAPGRHTAQVSGIDPARCHETIVWRR